MATLLAETCTCLYLQTYFVFDVLSWFFVLEVKKPLVGFCDCFTKAPKNENRFDRACGTFERNEEYTRLGENLKEKAVLSVLTPRRKFQAVVQLILNK
jgi:hypothetical protein